MVVIALLVGIIVALLAGLLTGLGGATLPGSIIAAGVAFAGTVTLALLIEKAFGAI